MKTITLRFKTDDEALIDNLVVSWLEDEGITILTAGSRDVVDLSYVKVTD